MAYKTFHPLQVDYLLTYSASDTLYDFRVGSRRDFFGGSNIFIVPMFFVALSILITLWLSLPYAHEEPNLALIAGTWFIVAYFLLMVARKLYDSILIWRMKKIDASPKYVEWTYVRHLKYTVPPSQLLDLVINSKDRDLASHEASVMDYYTTEWIDAYSALRWTWDDINSPLTHDDRDFYPNREIIRAVLGHDPASSHKETS